MDGGFHLKSKIMYRIGKTSFKKGGALIPYKLIV
ncbi:hypothetical protein SAMN05444394_2677 [Algoriphagus halophilus]|uniref:Uncharacterized protein n=1 Tax=Algoriphagus halophilus TaxID=226505 RepID=A0A1N6FRS6_9BACT|nr:hypothetical protein SAMN05444394_2677 [Algoriphagus halophilus]